MVHHYKTVCFGLRGDGIFIFLGCHIGLNNTLSLKTCHMALSDVGIIECELIMYETNSHKGYLDLRIWYTSCNRNVTILSTLGAGFLGF